MNLLVTLNKNYLKYLACMLLSFTEHNGGGHDVYVISDDLTQQDVEAFCPEQNNYRIIRFDPSVLKDAPVSKRYPFSVYYRLFAAKVLPDNVERVLYLDPDIIVIGDVSELYNHDLSDNYFIAASNIGKLLTAFNSIKNSAVKNAEYINSGVMVMNIALLRKEQNVEEVYKYIRQNRLKFTLPDQDIINGLYGDRIALVDHLVYNLGDRAINFYNLRHKQKMDLDRVKKTAKIIHYYSTNKPWKKGYKGILNCFYDEYESKLREKLKPLTQSADKETQSSEHAEISDNKTINSAKAKSAAAKSAAKAEKAAKKKDKLKTAMKDAAKADKAEKKTAKAAKNAKSMEKTAKNSSKLNKITKKSADNEK